MHNPMPSALAAAALLTASAAAQGNMDSVQIRTTELAPGVYMLTGRGGNLALAAGDDAVFLVDDQFAPLTEKIKAAVRAVTNKPIRFLVNTHWHFDHVGGNENLGKDGVLIVAHDNVRQRMAVEQFISRFNMKVPPSPGAALPVVTFSQMVTFHINGDDIHVIHVPKAHTDGDVLIHWVKADVIHMGDTFFNGTYPFVDLSSGGSVNGLIDAVGTALGYVRPTTKVIPGHGPLGGRAELAAYRDMLVGTRDAVKALIDQGKDKAAVIAAKPSAPWDGTYGRGSTTPDLWVETIFDSLTGGG